MHVGRTGRARAAVFAALAAAVGASTAPGTARADCQVSKMLELPVTMAGRRPTVQGRVGARDVSFILDSGAFYSTLSRASAAELGLKVEALPPSFTIQGVGGAASAGVAVVRDFSLGGVTLPRVEFIVGGSDTGATGLLGQNILGLADVEYDLPHGMVRLMHSTGCGKVNLAYWAGDKPVTVLKLERPERDGPFKPHTVARVTIDGRSVSAVFDSGAEQSMLTLAAARRIGVTPDSPGAVAVGQGIGVGRRGVASWRAPFGKIEIGGEAIARPQIVIADVELGGNDMLIGADFFLTHRLFVSNATRTMYVTYEGGPLFGLTPRGARTAAGEAIDLTDRAGAPTDAEGFGRRGAVLASNHRLAEALADFDRAVALAPREARYYRQRATARLADRQTLPALADLDRAVELAPQDAEARLQRAMLRLNGGDRSGATADLEAADAALAPSNAMRLTLAGLWDRVDRPAAALTSYDAWLRAHPEDARRANALNGRCWARAQLNRDLDGALADCNAALKLAPDRAAYLDSRALVRLRRGELDAALADYDSALRLAPRMAWSLYARALAAARKGRAEQAARDRAAALAIEPRIAERARRIGLE
ncbi:aspartyl protease family protein [Sphingomonas yunnanensis]|uniref:aspartyl protease family protein n=1 Tax=Sphingomonas yunnanensis TaxID=310400 RepID=UPI001CA608EC|nr:aspartyl protease family protein [Sphingomonas yunnanensis]MBY9062943.1 aspartyl protease family protein [Sphingomonas yunnanensis]